MYLIIYTPNRVTPSAVFDLKKKRFIANSLGLGASGCLYADLAHFECHGYKASVSNLDKLPRTTRGFIETKEIPVRLPLDALQATLAEALKPRISKSGNTAKPLRGGLTPTNRFQKLKVITDLMVSRATELRTEGFTWRTVAGSLGVGLSALKTAYRRMTPV